MRVFEKMSARGPGRRATVRRVPGRRREGLTSARRLARGYTLIEIMIVLAIVAILAAIALPSYQDSVSRSWRRKASACLVELAQAMERRYTASMAYDDPAALPARACIADDGMPVRYVIGFVNPPTATTFDIQAVPQGNQAVNDALCGTLAIDELGERTVSTATPPEACW